MEVYDGCRQLPLTKEAAAKDGPSNECRSRAQAEVKASQQDCVVHRCHDGAEPTQADPILFMSRSHPTFGVLRMTRLNLLQNPCFGLPTACSQIKHWRFLDGLRQKHSTSPHAKASKRVFPATTPSSPATSACRPSGRNAISA